MRLIVGPQCLFLIYNVEAEICSIIAWLVDMLKSLRNEVLQMESFGRIEKGAIVPDQPLSLPDGTRVQFALVSPKDSNSRDRLLARVGS